MKLNTKILLGAGGVVLLGSAGIVLSFKKTLHAELLGRMEQSARREVNETPFQLAAAIAAGDESRLLDRLQSIVETVDGSYAAALDARGRVVGHTNVAEVGRVQDDAAAAAALKSPMATSLETVRDGRPVLELFVPLFDESAQSPDEDFLLAASADDARGQRVGTLRLGLPLASTLATERHIAARLSRVVGLLGGATFLLLVFFMRGVLAPIRLLVAGTDKIKDGDYGGEIPVATNDEIGELAASFNAMSRTLSETAVSKGFFNDILDNIQDQIIVTDASGLITLVNPAVTRVLGWSKEELIGRPAASLIADEAVSFGAPAQNAAAHLAAKDGARVPVLFSSSALKDAEGRVTGWIGAAKDVSDLRKLEARMHQSEKLSAVGQLAAGVAHEINNPLGVILGFAQGLSRQLKDGDGLELPVKSIEREALRCKALVQNLLTFARTSHSERVALDLNVVVEQSLALIRPQAKMAQVAVEAALAKGLPPVLGNKTQIEQVIMNLAKNAIDAMPNGGTLSLTSELVRETPNSWVVLKIADTGTGIPAAILPKVFDPFFTTKPIGQGTGLGLSLVSEIVQRHSGELTVESRPGRTEFSVRLPVRTGEEMEKRKLELQREKLEADAAARAAKGAISHG